MKTIRVTGVITIDDDPTKCSKKCEFLIPNIDWRSNSTCGLYRELLKRRNRCSRCLNAEKIK